MVQSETPYVFTGSVRNAMSDLFDNPDSAFYKSAVSLCVGEIDRTDFSAFQEWLVHEGVLTAGK